MAFTFLNQWKPSLMRFLILHCLRRRTTAELFHWISNQWERWMGSMNAINFIHLSCLLSYPAVWLSFTSLFSFLVVPLIWPELCRKSTENSVRSSTLWQQADQMVNLLNLTDCLADADINVCEWYSNLSFRGPSHIYVLTVGPIFSHLYPIQCVRQA